MGLKKCLRPPSTKPRRNPPLIRQCSSGNRFLQAWKSHKSSVVRGSPRNSLNGTEDINRVQQFADDDEDAEYGVGFSYGDDLDGPHAAQSQQNPSSHYKHARKRFEQKWPKLLPEMAAAYNGDQLPTCVYGHPCCREERWTLLAIGGRNGNMRCFEPVEFVYRTCEREHIAAIIIANGYFPSAPERPTLAVSLDWLELFHLLHVSCGVSKYAFCQNLTDFLEAVTWDRVPPLESRFMDIYHNWLYLREYADEVVEASLQPAREDRTSCSLLNRCIACFYRPATTTSENTILHSNVDDSSICEDRSRIERLQQKLRSNVYLSIDGNMQHRRHAGFGNDDKLHRTSPMFVDTSRFRIPHTGLINGKHTWGKIHVTDPLWAFDEDENAAEQNTIPFQIQMLHGQLAPEAIPQLRQPRDDFTLGRTESSVESPQIRMSHVFTMSKTKDRCTSQFLASETGETANTHEKPKTLTAFDATGLIAIVCRHGAPLKYADLYRGENYVTVLAALEAVASELPSEVHKMVQYDIACRFKPFVERARPRLAKTCTFALNAFHAYAHNLPCQCAYGPVLKESLARTAAEDVEVLWSQNSSIVPLCRISSSQHRADILTASARHIIANAKKKLPTRLATRYKQIRKEMEEVRKELKPYAEKWLSEHGYEFQGTCEPYFAYLREKFSRTRQMLLDPAYSAMSQFSESYQDFHYTGFFTELCSLQGNTDFLDPAKAKEDMGSDGTLNGRILVPWKEYNHLKANRSRGLLKAEHELRIGNTLSGAHFDFTDFQQGSRLWRYYMGEVMLAHLHILRNGVFVTIYERQTTYARVFNRKNGTKETAKLMRKVSSRSSQIEKKMTEYTNFITFMKQVCRSETVDKILNEGWNIDPTICQLDTVQHEFVEESWAYAERLRSFWSSGFRWPLPLQELKQCYTLFRFERSEEELELLQIEMERVGQFLLDHFEHLTDLSSGLRKRRNWKEYINDNCKTMEAFIEHSCTFESMKIREIAKNLQEQWTKHQTLLPQQDFGRHGSRVKRPRMMKITAETVLSSNVQHVRKTTEGIYSCKATVAPGDASMPHSTDSSRSLVTVPENGVIYHQLDIGNDADNDISAAYEVEVEETAKYEKLGQIAECYELLEVLDD